MIDREDHAQHVLEACGCDRAHKRSCAPVRDRASQRIFNFAGPRLSSTSRAFTHSSQWHSDMLHRRQQANDVHADEIPRIGASP